MARKTDRPGSDLAYLVRFATAALLLVAATLVLVLVVLPQRYVLSSGFSESGLSFPEPRTPFGPPGTVQVEARRLSPPPSLADSVVRGPSEIFWDRVLPLLRARRFSDALPVFEEYLARYPSDRDARREYAVTLIAADRHTEAVRVFSELLENMGDPQIRLLLARTLRDLGQTEQASEHYETLSIADPQNTQLAVEWAQALSAASRYPRAEEILDRALERDPTSPRLRVELAKIYYYTNRLVAADQVLSSLSDAELTEFGALTVRDGVTAALATPDAPEAGVSPPPSLLERAVAAREEDEFEAAAGFFEEAIAADPTSAEVWQAYADFLQYELADLEGARQAMVEVEDLTGGTPELQLRLAQLEIWTDRLAEAEMRLTALLARREEDPAGTDSDQVSSDAHAMLGDLYRWDGRAMAAVEEYEAAQALVPNHVAAREGLAQVELDVRRTIARTERPRFGLVVGSLSDSDSFDRLEFGGEWYGSSADWIWGARAGTRWVRGLDLLGTSASQGGAFVDTEVGRWWRLGTIRTALRLGVDDLRSDGPDLLIGASIRFMDQNGGRTEVRIGHEPAYLRTNTLESVRGGLSENSFAVSYTRPLNERWTVAASSEVASLDVDRAFGSDASVRLQSTLSMGRSITRWLTLGLSGALTRFTDPAPTPDGARLFWDPNSAVSVGPYAMIVRPIDDLWTLNARLNSGIAHLRERGTAGTSIVPHLAGEAGLTREGERYRTALDLFYVQGRFDGYRAYGMTFSLSLRTGFAREGTP